MAFERALARWRGLGDQFCSRLNLSEAALLKIPIRYRKVDIPKRGGSTRTLHVPAMKLRAVQRSIVRTILRKLPVHPAAKGFVRRRSIVDHASLHMAKPYVVVCDIADFFTSTKAKRLRYRFQKIFGWSEATTDLLIRLTCLPDDGGLPQGAPTSPLLANIVNRSLDVRLEALAKKRHLDYSRYADDIAFSPKEAGHPSNPDYVIRIVQFVLEDYGYELRPNKCRILRRHVRQTVTGLVVNDKCNLSRTVRRRLRAAEHRANKGQSLSSPTQAGEETPMSADELKGWRAYQAMVARKPNR
jgi:RNA-directed DNA polymerase